MRRHVAAVRERVHPRPLRHPLSLGQLEKRAQVVDVRVNTPVGDEAEQMDVAAALSRAPERGSERAVLRERAVLDREAHAREVLEQDPARPDREVPHLRVPHLSHWKPDRLTGGGERRVRIAIPQRVEGGRARELDGVSRPGRGDPPAVQDDEDDGLQAASAAARQIASNDTRSSEAPPTSAPSTSGSGRSTAALSGLTDPP